MKKVAVFGKPGGGKSTLSKKLSIATGISLYSIDLFEYKKNGERISLSNYSVIHDEIISKESWIIDGLGRLDSFWSRLEAADTLIYIDLPYRVHYWWATKRMLLSLFVKPEGWPEGCSVLKGTIASWKYLRLSPQFWTEKLFDKILSVSPHKEIHRIKSIREFNDFLKEYGA